MNRGTRRNSSVKCHLPAGAARHHADTLDRYCSIASLIEVPAPVTSGLPRLADILRVIRHVAKVPKADIASRGNPAVSRAQLRL